MHDNRTRLGPRPWSARSGEHFPDLVFSTVIPRKRGRVGEAPSYGFARHPSRPAQRGRGRRISSWRRRWLRVARPKPGMGRGAGGDPCRSLDGRGGAGRERQELRELARRADRAQSGTTTAGASTRDGLQALAGSLGRARACCSRCSCAPRAGGTYEAGGGRSGAGAPREFAGLATIPALCCARGTTPESDRAGR